jgi:hypothetical protein
MKDACGRQLFVRNKKYTSWYISTAIKYNLLGLKKIKNKLVLSLILGNLTMLFQVKQTVEISI